MADNVSKIGSDGGDDYSTVDGWQDDTQYDLESGTTREIGELRGESHSGASSAVELVGASTNSSYYRWLRSMDGHEFDHTDKTGARLSHTSSDAYYCIMNEEYARFGGSEGSSSGSVGVKWTHTAESGSGYVMRDDFNAATGGTTLSQIVMYDCSSSSTGTLAVCVSLTTNHNMKCFNCLAFNISGATVYGFWTQLYTYNCVVYDMTGTTNGYGYYILSNGVYNCYAGTCTTKTYNTGTVGDYNAADNTDSDIFTNNLQSKAGGDQFASVTVSSENFHLKSGAALIGAGNDVHSNDWDIDGSVVGARNDIGVDQYTAPVSPMILIAP